MSSSGGNSQEIIRYKQNILADLMDNDNIVKAINAKSKRNQEPLDPSSLAYTHLFPYGYIPEQITEAGAYIGVEVTMPNVSTANYFFKDILITFTIICHQDIMQMRADEPLGSTGATRLDYLSVEIDKLFNRREDIGSKKLELVSNIETALDMYHRCRIMRFQTQEVVVPPCST